MSGSVIHDAGQFNRQLSIENQINVPDGFGGYARNYVVEGSVWARLCPEVTVLEVAADLKSQKSTHRVVMRFRSGIVAGTRLITGSRTFEVKTVSDPDETRRYLECMVIEK